MSAVAVTHITITLASSCLVWHQKQEISGWRAWQQNSQLYLSHSTTKPTKWHVRLAKTLETFIKYSIWAAAWQIQKNDLGVWSESSLCVQWVGKDPRFFHVDSKNWQMPRLIWVFTGCTSAHYARRYMSNGMIHVQQSFREFAHAFNKFWLVESCFFLIQDPVAADTSYGGTIFDQSESRKQDVS